MGQDAREHPLEQGLHLQLRSAALRQNSEAIREEDRRLLERSRLLRERLDHLFRLEPPTEA